MKKLIALVVVLPLIAVGADYTPISKEATGTLQGKTLTTAGSITFDSSVVIDGTATNQMDVTLASTGVDNGNLRLISGSTANADGDDIGILVRGTDTGATAVTYCDINVDMTDADTGTEDATVTVAIPVAGTLATALTIDGTSIGAESVALTPNALTTNAAVFAITANGASTDYTAYTTFSSENAACVVASTAIQTNTFALLVTIGGTNYYIGCAASN